MNTKTVPIVNAGCNALDFVLKLPKADVMIHLVVCGVCKCVLTSCHNRIYGPCAIECFSNYSGDSDAALYCVQKPDK